MSLGLLVFAPLLGALCAPLLARYAKMIHTGWFALLIPVVLFGLYASSVPSVAGGASQTGAISWAPSLGLHFPLVLDGLSLLFSLLITGIGSLVVLYSIFYMDRAKEALGSFYAFLLLFMTAMLGVVQSGHLLSLYAFWELTSISSFLLIGFWWRRERSWRGAVKSMAITVFGGLLMLGGFILLGQMGGTYDIRELVAQADALSRQPYFELALLLVLFGAFTKSAQFPFYIWLPDAMEAPTPVSAYLHSATMVKAGLYVVARFTPVFAPSSLWIWLVSGIGLLTLLWGSVFAMKQTDLKGILAFSTVSQLGLIMSLLGAASIAYHVPDAGHTAFRFAAFAALFHLVNHALFKGGLFMIAGIVDHEAGTRDIRKLGGLMAAMPMSFTLAAIGALSMAGLPPFNGFLSKELFFTAMLAVREFQLFSFDTWGALFPAIAWIASAFTFAYSLYFVSRTFMGARKSEALPREPHEAPFGMLVSPALLMLLSVIVFFIPNALGRWILRPAVAAMQPFLYSSPADVQIEVSAWHGWTPELWMTIGLAAVGLLLVATADRWKRLYRLQPDALSLNRLYGGIRHALVRFSARFANAAVNGSLRRALLLMLAPMVGLLFYALAAQRAFRFAFPSDWARIPAYEWLAVVILLAATIATALAKTRLMSILSLGAVGYSVAFFFVIFNAPDLALTQLVIETVSVALFLLVFQKMPRMQAEPRAPKRKLVNALVAAACGACMTALILAAHLTKLKPSIASYYKETVSSLAGGGNIVNVILVDYRGFDTLFEITVLGIASIGIIALIRLRLAKKGGGGELEDE